MFINYTKELFFLVSSDLFVCPDGHSRLLHGITSPSKAFVQFCLKWSSGLCGSLGIAFWVLDGIPALPKPQA